MAELGEAGGHHSATGARANDHHLGIQVDFLCVGDSDDRASQRGGFGNWFVGSRIADGLPAWIQTIGSRVGVGEEGCEALDGLEERPTPPDRAGRPAQQNLLAPRTWELRKRLGPVAQRHRSDRRLERGEQQPQLAQVGWLGDVVERCGGQRGVPLRLTVVCRFDERAEHGCQRTSLPG